MSSILHSFHALHDDRDEIKYIILFKYCVITNFFSFLSVLFTFLWSVYFVHNFIIHIVIESFPSLPSLCKSVPMAILLLSFSSCAAQWTISEDVAGVVLQSASADIN